MVVLVPANAKNEFSRRYDLIKDFTPEVEDITDAIEPKVMNKTSRIWTY